MVFDAHEKAFAFFGGVCVRETYGNMLTAVGGIRAGKGRAWNSWFLWICSHSLVEQMACTVVSGWEHGQFKSASTAFVNNST